MSKHKSRLALALAVFLVSAVPVTQQLRESVFFRRGQEQFKAKSVYQFPVVFAGRSIRVEDSLPHTGDHSYDQRMASVTVWIDEARVLHEAPAMIRVGYSNNGRYNRWLNASRFMRTDGTDSFFILARRRALARDSIHDVLTIDARGHYRVETWLATQRASSWPYYLAVSGLGDETATVYAMEHWTWLPGFHLQIVAPWVACAFSGLFLTYRLLRHLLGRFYTREARVE